jgi:hypothetical protein
MEGIPQGSEVTRPGELVTIKFLGGYRKVGLILSCVKKDSTLGEKNKVITLLSLDGKISEVVLHPRDEVVPIWGR